MSLRDEIAGLVPPPAPSPSWDFAKTEIAKALAEAAKHSRTKFVIRVADKKAVERAAKWLDEEGFDVVATAPDGGYPILTIKWGDSDTGSDSEVSPDGTLLSNGDFMSTWTA